MPVFIQAGIHGDRKSLLCRACLQGGVRVYLEKVSNSKSQCPECGRYVDLRFAEIVYVSSGERTRGIPPVTTIVMPKVRTQEQRVPRQFGASRKSRSWEFEITPFFKRVREPLIDVFREAKKVKIVIDLGSFSKGEVDIDIKPDKYIVIAKHEYSGQEFRKEIDLPPDVDIEKTVEHFKNGILAITLPKRKNTKTKRGKKKR